MEIWERIKAKTTYRVYYSTEDLIRVASHAIADLPSVPVPQIRTSKQRIQMTEEGVEIQFLSEKVSDFENHAWKIPDILGYVQQKTELTRGTLSEILIKSKRLKDVFKNPQLFLDWVAGTIRKTLYDLMIAGIKYLRIGNAEYEMRLFDSQELEVYLNEFAFAVGSCDHTQADKTIYEKYVPLDSEAENQFAKDCETSEQVRFYFKLPEWFKIPTPIENYNPDWAVVFNGERKIYFVAETKSTGSRSLDFDKLRDSELKKIQCGHAHFSVLPEVEYRVAQRLSDLAR